jgi:DNA-binding NtrC family response regulator
MRIHGRRSDVTPRILVVDDEENMRRSLKLLLSDLTQEIDVAAGGEEAFELFGRREHDVVLTDLRMPGMDGLALLQKIKDLSPDTPVIVVTAFGSVESAVDAMKEGAFDYVTKPFKEDEIKLIIKRALRVSSVLTENRILREELEGKYNFNKIIGNSKGMIDALNLAGEVASTGTTVLLLGESGTGKELFARAIHYNSPRRSGPFIAINCAAIPDTLLESELFGHERGAFTGAEKRRRGKFELAAGGTVLLDEVADMSGALQAKLLRVLEERQFERLGGDEAIRFEGRLICATNKDLTDLVADGSFREDLYYRVSAYPIRLPALRERREDIVPIAKDTIADLANQMGKKVPGLSEDARRFLLQHSWQGNIRELKNAIERAVILTKGDQIEAGVLQPPLDAGVGRSRGRNGEEGDFVLPDKGVNMEEVERDFILQALDRSQHNTSAAAKLLGVSRPTMRYRIIKHGIQVPAKEG